MISEALSFLGKYLKRYFSPLKVHNSSTLFFNRQHIKKTCLNIDIVNPV